MTGPAYRTRSSSKSPAGTGTSAAAIFELLPGERIVQSWCMTQLADEHDDSIITVTLEDAHGGTLVTLAHNNVPDEEKSYHLTFAQIFAVRDGAVDRRSG